jgi:hypothetical protein
LPAARVLPGTVFSAVIRPLGFAIPRTKGMQVLLIVL